MRWTIPEFILSFAIGGIVAACGQPTTRSPSPPSAATSAPPSASATPAHTWRKLSLPADVWLFRDVACSSVRQCVLAGQNTNYRALILVTNDAGQTWQRPTFRADLGPVFRVSCPTDIDCYGITRSVEPPEPYFLVQSHDGGSNWATSALPTDANAISCWNATSCLLIGGRIPDLVALKTTDAGTNWVTVNTSMMAGRWLYDVACPDALHCWISADAYPKPARVYATSDGGKTWSEQGVHSTDVGPLFCVSAERCWLPSGDRVFDTDNGGATWIEQRLPGANWINSVGCSSAYNCVAVGGPEIVSSRDGGQTWGLDLSTALTSMHLNAVACPSFCLAVGESGPLGAAQFTDGP